MSLKGAASIAEANPELLGMSPGHVNLIFYIIMIMGPEVVAVFPSPL